MSFVGSFSPSFQKAFPQEGGAAAFSPIDIAGLKVWLDFRDITTLFQDAARLNRYLLKMPYQTADAELELSSNVWEIYQAALYGDSIPVELGGRAYFLARPSQSWSSWDEWCQGVVWYGNRRGAYFYGQTAVERQIAGHYGEAFASDQ